MIAELSAPKIVNAPERPSKLDIKVIGGGGSNKSDQQTCQYRRVSLGSPMGPPSRLGLLEQQASPRPFRKVMAAAGVDDGDDREDHEPLSKSRKESAHSSPSKPVVEMPPQQVRLRHSDPQSGPSGSHPERQLICTTGWPVRLITSFC